MTKCRSGVEGRSLLGCRPCKKGFRPNGRKDVQYIRKKGLMTIEEVITSHSTGRRKGFTLFFVGTRGGKK